MKLKLISKKSSLIRNLILVFKITISTIFALILSVYLIFLYKNYSYSEKQRDLWNSAMAEKPSDSDRMLYISDSYGSTMKNRASREKLKNEEAPHWNILWPNEIDLNKLPFSGMTEAELLSLPKERKSYAYYQEVISRFMLDPENVTAILSDMKSTNLAHADFFSELCLLSRRSKNAYTELSEFNVKRIQGYKNFQKTVLSGNYEAYALFLFLNKKNDNFMERELLKILNEKAKKGDPKSMRELANLLFLREKRNFSSFDLIEEWDKNWESVLPIKKTIPFLPENYRTTYEKQAKKAIDKIRIVQQMNIIMEYYKKSAEQGDLDSMYLWINQKIDTVPYLCNRSDWSRIKKYYNTLVENGDWRIYKDFVCSEKNYFNNFLIDYYSTKSINNIISSIEKTNRKDGSFIYLKKSILENYTNTDWNKKLIPEKENLIINLLKNLQKLSHHECYSILSLTNTDTRKTERIISILLTSLENCAKKNDPKALYVLAEIYEKGKWKNKDLNKSSELLSKALRLGNEGKDISIYIDNEELQRDSNFIEFTGGYFPLNYAIPKKYIEINLNHDFTQRNSSKAYEVALEYRNNYLFNSDIFIRMQPTFEYYLGKMNENGEGSEKDINRAIYWYQQGTNKGNPHCTLKLAYLLENLLNDKKKAISHYEYALERSLSENTQNLEKHIKKQKRAMKDRQ